MSMLDRLAAAAQAFSRFREASGTTVDADEADWRRITGDGLRDLSPLTRRRAQEIAVYLWRTNLLANRLVELPLAYLLAEGVSLAVDDPDAQTWLDAFWNDPINQMAIKLPKKVRELALFGEQCYPVFLNKMNGHMRLGYLDPSLIETVVTDPDNVEQPIGIVTVKNKRGEARRYKVIVNGPESVFGATARRIRETFEDGECFYFTVNDLSSAPRGNSDLLASADWLDAYEQFLFGEVERAAFMRAFFWDVTLQGATQEEVEARASRISAPKPGGVRIHNQAETWDAVTPDLKAADNAEAARLFRNHVLGGGTVPEHWYGGGGDVNRATGDSMGEPTFKIFSMRQRFLGHMLETIGQYQIYRRIYPTGPLPDPADFDPALRVRCDWPEMSPRDTTKYAAALQQVVASAAVAVDRGMLSEETGVMLVAAVAGRLGVDVDPKAELEAARAEGAKRNEAAYGFPDIPDDEEAPPQAGA